MASDHDPEFLTNASKLDRFLFWLHNRLYTVTEIMPAGEGAVLIECSCGGHAQVRHQNDGEEATVELATCPRWKIIRKLQRKNFATAKVHREKVYPEKL